jgi:alpha-L-rhamnosidase
LNFVKAAHQSARGKIVSEWRRSGSEITITVTIPANSRAVVFLPDGQREVGGGVHTFRVKG